jgi:hypothetical protein
MFFKILGFEFRTFTLSHPTTSIFYDGFFKIGSHKLFAWAWLQTAILLICAYWVARIMGMSHQCLAHFFIFIHGYIIFLPYSPSYILSLYPPPFTGTSPQTGTVLPSCLLFLKIKRHFYLFMISIQRISLWHFHGCMYCIPNWFIPSIFLLFTLVLLWWFKNILKLNIHSCIENISPISTFFTSFFYLLPPIRALPLA